MMFEIHRFNKKLNLHVSTCIFKICVKFLIWCDFWVKWIIIVLCIFLWFLSEIKGTVRRGCLLIMYCARHVNVPHEHVRFPVTFETIFLLMCSNQIVRPSDWLAVNNQ